MMSIYKFSTASNKRLQTCDARLQEIMHEAIGTGVMDFTILCGHRSNEDQQKAYDSGNSKALPGKSKHNVYPSQAIDIAPYPINWSDTERFAKLAGVVLTISAKKGIALRWGGDFKSIKDMPHFEIN